MMAFEESTLATTDQSRTTSVDFDLHHLIGIRLLNPTPGDVRAVAQQLGIEQSSLQREPDILIRFVAKFPSNSALNRLGLHEAGYSQDAFFVLQTKHKAPTKVHIEFNQIGQQVEIVCESGLAAVPLLIAVLNMTAITRGILPLHAAAFRYQGSDYLVTGWSKGGKTETLLTFTSQGAEYIGDEWIYIDTATERLYGVPEPIRVWDWHLQQLPTLRRRIGWQRRARLSALGVAQRVSKFLLRTLARSSGAKRGLRQMVRLFSEQMYVDVPPKTLSGTPTTPRAGTLETIVFVSTWESPEVCVEAVAPEEVARRMAASLAYERLPFMAYYHMYRFAFPDRRNPVVDNIEERETEMLTRLFAGKPCCIVNHPYPVSFSELFEALKQYDHA